MSLFDPRKAISRTPRPPAPPKRPMQDLGLRGDRVLSPKTVPPATIPPKSEMRRVNEELQDMPRGALVRDPNGKWLYDERGLFFRRRKGG